VPVLLLAQGDSKAKELLRRAIEARYGISPPAIDNLIMDMQGRVRAKVGPVMSWVPLQIRASFRFPAAIRWDFTARPAGVPVQRGAEAFDGSTYRQARGRRARIIDNPDVIHSLRHRVWAMAAVLLTPLGDHFVHLDAVDEYRLEATNTTLGDRVQLVLRDDYTLDQVQARCLNPDSGQIQTFSLRASTEQLPVDDMMLPKCIRAFWDDQPYYEVKPVHIENLTAIADAVFTLETDASSQA